MGKNREQANELAENTKVTISQLLGEETVNAFRDTLYGDYAIDVVHKTADGTIVESKEYVLAHKMGNVTSKIIANEELRTVTNRIKGIDRMTEQAIRTKAYALYVASTLTDENGESAIKASGFKSLGEYAYYVHDIKEKTANQYVRMGRLFFTPTGGMKEGLPTLSTSQLIPLLARVDNEETGDIHSIIEFFTPDHDENSLLTAGMGAGKIKSRLADYDAGVVDKHGRSLLSLEERKERKEALKAQKEAAKKEAPAEAVQDEKPEKLSPERQVAASFIRTTIALETLFTTDIPDEKKEQWSTVQAKLNELRETILSLAGVEG